MSQDQEQTVEAPADVEEPKVESAEDSAPAEEPQAEEKDAEPEVEEDSVEEEPTPLLSGEDPNIGWTVQSSHSFV